MAEMGEIGYVIEVLQRATLRTQLLFALDGMYPRWVTTEILYAVDKEMSTSVIDRELAYLEEKHLLERKARTAKISANKITARGRDFLDGHIQEVGLLDPEACKGK